MNVLEVRHTHRLKVDDTCFMPFFTGYDGEFCQNDANGCEAITCLEGQQCFDYPAPLVGAECTCPEGSIADSDSKCIGGFKWNHCNGNTPITYYVYIQMWTNVKIMQWLLIVHKYVLTHLVVTTAPVMMAIEQPMILFNAKVINVTFIPEYYSSYCMKWLSVDINECEEYNDCHHSCNNTEGSYYCSCNVGFILSEDNRTCTG